jgi:hypothetical protein
LVLEPGVVPLLLRLMELEHRLAKPRRSARLKSPAVVPA